MPPAPRFRRGLPIRQCSRPTPGSTLAAPAPGACTEVYTAWKENDPKVAAEKQQRLVAPANTVAVKHGVPGLKYACDLNGYYGGNPRIPLLPLTAEQKAEITQAMADVRN